MIAGTRRIIGPAAILRHSLRTTTMNCLSFSACQTTGPAVLPSAETAPAASSTSAPHGFERAIRIDDMPAKGLKQYVLAANKRSLCVVADGAGGYHAIDDLCPHKQGVMSLGDIEDSNAAHGVCVRCPRHRKKFPGGLKFRVSDGAAWVDDAAACLTPFEPEWKTPVHPVVVRDGWLYVAIEPLPNTVMRGSAAGPNASQSRGVQAAGGDDGGGGSGERKEGTAGAAVALAMMMAVSADGESDQADASISVPSPTSATAIPTAPLAPAAALAPASSSAAAIDLSRFERVCAVSELPTKGLRRHVLQPSGDAVCIVSSGSGATQTLRAIGDVCPHKDASLSEGDIEDSDSARGACVKCPRHRKKFAGGLNFSAETGRAWVTSPSACWTKFDSEWAVPVFEVVVSEGQVHVSRAPVAGTGYGGARGKGGDKDEGEKEEKKAKKKEKRDKETKGDTDSVAATSTVVAVGATTAAAASTDSVVSTHQRLAADSPLTAALSSDAPASWIPCAITDIETVSADSRIYTVAPLQGAPVPAAPTGVDRSSWHVSLGLMDAPMTAESLPSGGDSASLVTVHREYTALSTLSEWVPGASVGSTADSAPAPQPPRLRLLIKLYPNGKLTSRLASHGVGHVVFVSPPETTLTLPRMVPPELLLSPSSVPAALASEAALAASAPMFGPSTAVGLIAGGTGVTPILQLAQWCLSEALSGEQQQHPRPSNVFIVVSNHSRADALGDREVRALAAAYPDRVSVLHTFTRAGASGDPVVSTAPFERDGQLGNVFYTRGRIDAAMLSAFLPTPAAASGASLHLARVVTSGPNGMMAAAAAALAQAGHHPDCIVELEA